MRTLIAMSATRRPSRVTVDAVDEGHAAALAWFEMGGSDRPMVRHDGKRWIVCDGRTMAYVTILGS